MRAPFHFQNSTTVANPSTQKKPHAMIENARREASAGTPEIEKDYVMAVSGDHWFWSRIGKFGCLVYFIQFVILSAVSAVREGLGHVGVWSAEFGVRVGFNVRVWWLCSRSNLCTWSLGYVHPDGVRSLGLR